MADTIATASQTLTAITPEIHKIAPINGFTTIMGITINPMVIVLALVLATLGYFLWQGQRRSGQNTFDVWDLVMDRFPDGTRRASGIKSTYQVAFLVSTWVIVDQEIKGTLNDAIFGLYLGTWCASLIAKVVFDKQDPPQFPGRNDDQGQK